MEVPGKYIANYYSNQKLKGHRKKTTCHKALTSLPVAREEGKLFHLPFSGGWRKSRPFLSSLTLRMESGHEGKLSFYSSPASTERGQAGDFPLVLQQPGKKKRNAFLSSLAHPGNLWKVARISSCFLKVLKEEIDPPQQTSNGRGMSFSGIHPENPVLRVPMESHCFLGTRQRKAAASPVKESLAKGNGRDHPSCCSGPRRRAFLPTRTSAKPVSLSDRSRQTPIPTGWWRHPNLVRKAHCEEGLVLLLCMGNLNLPQVTKCACFITGIA